jgi:hypothetical protein
MLAKWDLEECCRLSPAMQVPTEARMRAAKKNNNVEARTKEKEAAGGIR